MDGNYRRRGAESNWNRAGSRPRRLDRRKSSREDVSTPMKTLRNFLLVSAIFANCLCGAVYTQQAQNSQTPKKEQPAAGVVNRLTIEVTGGDSNKPVENASVYVKTVEEHSLLKIRKLN